MNEVDDDVDYCDHVMEVLYDLITTMMMAVLLLLFELELMQLSAMLKLFVMKVV